MVSLALEPTCNAGVLRKDDEGRIDFPYTALHVDFMLEAAA
jgi:hypothetical protein